MGKSRKKIVYSRKKEEQTKKVLLIIGVVALLPVVAMPVGYSFLG